MDCLQQCIMRTIPWKMKLVTVNHSRSWSASKEGDTVHLMELEVYCVLPFTKSDIKFRQILFPIEPIKSNYQ